KICPVPLAKLSSTLREANASVDGRCPHRRAIGASSFRRPPGSGLESDCAFVLTKQSRLANLVSRTILGRSRSNSDASASGQPSIRMIRLQQNSRLPVAGCAVVPAKPNPDARGCLYEIYRAEWPGAFPTVQWNACVSKAGVVRGVHVHVDYEEYYTLLAGRGVLGLHDIRRESPTFGGSITIDWRAD